MLGIKLVDWILRREEVPSRDAALAIGQLMLDAGMFSLVDDKHSAGLLDDSAGYPITSFSFCIIFL